MASFRWRLTTASAGAILVLCGAISLGADGGSAASDPLAVASAEPTNPLVPAANAPVARVRSAPVPPATTNPEAPANSPPAAHAANAPAAPATTTPKAPAASAPPSARTDAPSGAGSPAQGQARRAAELLRQGKAAEAAPVFAMALAVDPGDEASIEGRVRSLILCGRWREALEEARRYAAALPASTLVKTALGEALYRAGRFDEAAATVAPLVTVDAPQPQPFALLTRALVHAAEGRDDDAIVFFDRALALAPKERDVVYWAAGAAETRAESVTRLERYLALSAGDDADRIEGAKGTIRLYKALGERPVWVPAGRPASLDIPMQPLLDRSAHITGFIVEIMLGGAGSDAKAKPVRVLLDTGSTGLFLVDRIAAKAGFAPLSEDTTFAGGGTGQLSTRRGLFGTFALGEMRFTDVLVSTTTDEIEPTGRYHGVLGLSIFRGYEVTLDLSHNRLRLGPPPADRGAVPYWTVESQMLVEAGTSTGQKGLFLFDTGATRSVISLDFAGLGRLGESASIRGFGGNVTGARVVHGTRLRFQDLETLDPTLTATDLSQRSRLGGVEVSGYLGLDLLARNVIKVDTVGRRIQVLKPVKK